jgi:hypothetical protein
MSSLAEFASSVEYRGQTRTRWELGGGGDEWV